MTKKVSEHTTTGAAGIAGSALAGSTFGSTALGDSPWGDISETPYGRAAVEALGEAIERCRASETACPSADPTLSFSPVTIVVPSIALGMSVLQELAVIQGGVFGVRHMTVAGLADHICNLSNPLPETRRTNRAVAAALRQIPDDEFGVFLPVREHPSTERVLVQTLRELEQLSEASLEQLKHSSEQAKDLVEMERAVRGKLKDKWIANSEMLERAYCLVPGSREALKAELGEIVVFLPQRLTAPAAKLLRECQPAEIILGKTGIGGADRVPEASAKMIVAADLSSDLQEASGPEPDEVVATKAAIEAELPAIVYTPVQTAASTVSVVSAPTPEDEVRLAIRGAVEALANGTPAHMIAIATADSHLRILIDHLEEAALGYTFANGFPLKERILPRAVLRLMEHSLLEQGQVKHKGLPRQVLMEILASSPMIDPAAWNDPDRQLAVPDAAWNRVSKEAKVSDGDWKEKLERYIQIQEKSALRKTDDKELDARKAKWCHDNISYARSLLAFVQNLEADISKVSSAKSWKKKVSAVRRLARKYFPALVPPNYVSEENTLPQEEAGEAEVADDQAGKDEITEELAAKEPTDTNELTADTSLPARELPEAEKAAAKELLSLLKQLEELDHIEPSPDHSSFVQALRQELDESSSRAGKGGIRVLNLDSLLAGSVDHLFILGMAEGIFPENLKEDSLLSESCRNAVEGLTPRGERIHTQHRFFLTALQLPQKSLTISYPRQGHKGDALPSRWLLDLARELGGDEAKDVVADNLDEYLRSVDGKNLRGVVVDSLTSAMSRSGSLSTGSSNAVSDGTSLEEAGSGSAGSEGTGPDGASSEAAGSDSTNSYGANSPGTFFAANSQEFNLQSLIGRDPKDLPSSDLATRNMAYKSGAEMQNGRKSPDFTRFDGNLRTFQGFNFSEPLSPNRLEKWFACPHAFFVSCILGANPPEEFQETDRLSPLVKGQIIHNALDEFFKKQRELAPNKTIPPDKAWKKSHKEELEKIASRLCDEAIADFSFGLPMYQAIEKQAILNDLSDFLDKDSEYRKANKAVPTLLEAEFGYHGQPRAKYPLSGGKNIALRGRIDRVDVSPDAIMVIDYKTGKHNSGETNQKYTNLNEDNPHGEGRKLQLPLYIKGAQAILKTQDPALLTTQDPNGSQQSGAQQSKEAQAVYWFVSASSDFYRKELPINDTSKSKIDEALSVVRDGISDGLFPPAPHEDGKFAMFCQWCNPDGFGPAKHKRTLRSKHGDQKLESWLEIAYPKHLEEIRKS